MDDLEKLKLNIVEEQRKIIKDIDKTTKVIKEDLDYSENYKRVKQILDEGYKHTQNIYKRPNIIKEALLVHLLDKVYMESLKLMKVKDSNNIRYNYIYNYIKENDNATKIISKLQTKTEFLAEAMYYLNKKAKSILEANENNEEIIITLTDKEDFIDSLNKNTLDDITNAISDKVQKTNIEFIYNVQKDKEAIDDIITKTQEKIETTVKESLIESYERNCVLEVNNIKNNRMKSLYEIMVTSLSEKSYKINTLKEQFLDENNKVDFDKVLESVNIMYTFAELMNTMKLQKIDESYIEKLYNEITK